MSLTLTPVSGFSKTVNFSDVVFPVSYHHNITLSKASGQSSATYACTGQKVKFLPGSQLVIDDGVTVSAGTLSFYSAFMDRVSNGKSSYTMTYSSTRYPIKDGSSCRVLGSGTLNATNLGGDIYADSSATISATTSNATINEPMFMKTTSGTMLRAMAEVLKIKQQVTRYNISDFTKSKLFVGVNVLGAHTSYLPTARVILSNGSSTTVSNGYQGVIHYTTQTTYRFELVSNIYTIDYYRGTAKTTYPKNEVINLSNSHIADVTSNLYSS